MTKVRSALSRTNSLLAALALAVTAVIGAVPQQASAANVLLQRSLNVSSTVPSDDLTAPDGTTYSNLAPGDPRNGAKVDHTYTLTPATPGTIQGFTIEYCDTAFGWVGTGPCAGAPSGFSASAWDGATVTIGGQAFTINANADNYITLTNATGFAADGSTAYTMPFVATADDYFVNPNDAYRTFLIGGTTPTNGTYFAHISTFSSVASATSAFTTNDPNAAVVDEGTVTNDVTRAISLYTRVQETLNFSVEGDEALNGPTPKGAPGCAALTASGSLRMGDSNFALSTAQAYGVTSFFRLATNASGGTIVYYSGDTLKSGASNDINQIGAIAAASTPGTEQFGLGVDVTLADHTALQPTAPYNDAGNNNFAFESASATTPVQIASAPGIVNCETLQVDYIANIAETTPAGIYTTKINYIAAPVY